jgi:hypothetical protein
MDQKKRRQAGVKPVIGKMLKDGLAMIASGAVIAAAVAVMTVVGTVPSMAQAAGAGLGAHLGTGAGQDLINADIAFAVLKYLLAGFAGVAAAYYLWAMGRRNHHTGAHAGLVACAALAAFVAVSWGSVIQAGVQTLWQTVPDITNATAVTLEQW